MTDEELIEAWRAGDQRAATDIVARHSDALARFAVSTGEQQEIEELVQDTFVRAFSAMDSFRGESSLRTWLFTIERRLILDRRRASKRSARTEELDDQQVGGERAALDLLIADESIRRIRSAVHSLSPMQRDVFRLRVEQGLSYREIAEALDSTEGSARVHYHNALRAVKESMND